MKESNKGSYHYLTYLTSIFSFFFILPSVLLKKIIVLPFVGNIPISILFTGIYFMLLDVITEVYGYKEAKRTLFAALISYTFFVFIIACIIQIPSPENINIIHQNAYNYIFDNLIYVWISVMICGLCANTVNMLILSKWKALLRGRFFWLRSISTSFSVLVLYTMLSNYFAFGFSSLQYGSYTKLVFVSLSAKLITLILFAYPATILCLFLKYKEGVDVYDHPYKFSSPFM